MLLCWRKKIKYSVGQCFLYTLCSKTFRQFRQEAYAAMLAEED
jgi:hypothetical protein